MTRLYNRLPDPFQPAANADDITNASRSIVWLHNDFVVVYDRAGSKHPGLFKRFNLNLVDKPQIAGPLVREVTPRGQQLFVQTLLPSNDSASVSHAAANLNPIAELEPTRYQLSIEDPSRPREVRFLNVLQGADPGASAVHATLVHSLAGTALPLLAGARTLLVTGLRPRTQYGVALRGGSVSIVLGGRGASTDAAGVLDLAV